MISYRSDLEKFTDGIDFDSTKNCIWVVYPPGCAGDLLASIINFHYVETGAKFRGITNAGQVIFRSSDQKYSNQLDHENKILFDDKFFFKIADILANINLNWSKMDQFIFSNHYYSVDKVHRILNTFENCKIIRLLPKTTSELEISQWLAVFKNQKIALPIPIIEIPNNSSCMLYGSVNDPRLLEVTFGDLINPKTFDSIYQSVLSHLGLSYAVINYNFIQSWIDKQDKGIQKCLLRLTSG